MKPFTPRMRTSITASESGCQGRLSTGVSQRAGSARLPVCGENVESYVGLRSSSRDSEHDGVAQDAGEFARIALAAVDLDAQESKPSAVAARDLDVVAHDDRPRRKRRFGTWYRTAAFGAPEADAAGAGE